MVFHGIWVRSYLVCGILLQVSKGQNTKYKTLKWNQNLYKQQTTNEPRLGAFDRVNTTDVPEEFEPVTNAIGVIINKPVPGQEMVSDVINAGQTTINADKVSATSLPQAITRTTIEARLGTFDNASTREVRKKLETGVNSTGVINNQTATVREMQNNTLKSEIGIISKSIKQGDTSVLDAKGRLKPQNMVVMTTRALTGKSSKGYLQLYSVLKAKKGNYVKKAGNIRKQAEPKGYGDTDDGDEGRKQMPPNETENQIATEPQVVFLHTINTTYAPQTFEPITNLTTETLQLEIFYRINTTDVPKEFEPVTNTTSVIINKLVQGQELYTDILTIEPSNINRNKVNNVSLSQNQTSITPRQEAFDNETDIPNEFEPATNTTRGIANQQVTEREMQTYIVQSGNGNTSILNKQKVTKVHEIESSIKPQKAFVRIVNGFKGNGSKDQVPWYSIIGNNRGRDSIRARKNRKRDEYKSKKKESGKKFKKY